MDRTASAGCARALGGGAVLCLSFLCAALPAAPITMVDTGPSANRVDIVFLGDGYTQANLNAGIYEQHIQSYLDYMFSAGGFLADPFPRYRNFFNVHRIDVASPQSGADIPSQSIFVDTALDASYDSFGIDRLLTVSTNKANAIRNQALAGTDITADMQLVTVNHSTYGGSGGSWAVFAGGNGSAREIALHELGHSFSQLADEYVSYTGPYPDPEPSARNVTKNPTGQKWSHWLGFDDPRGPHLDINVYEGAHFYPTGVYRPSLDSKMRTLNRAFDAVSREALIHDIYELVDPVDDWLDNGAPVVDEELWVAVVDPEVIRLEWYVDGALVPEADGGQFDATDFGYGPGTYAVTARAYDGILDHAFGGGLFDLARTNLAALEQSITWTLTLRESMPGDYNGDRTIDLADYDEWKMNFGSNSALGADGNNNGIVDAADYLIWRKHFNDRLRSADQGQVPEATTGSLALILFVGVGLCRPARVRERHDGAGKDLLA